MTEDSHKATLKALKASPHASPAVPVVGQAWLLASRGLQAVKSALGR